MTAPRKPSAASSAAASPSPKLTLVLAGAAIAAITVFALQPSGSSATPERAQETKAAASSSAVRPERTRPASQVTTAATTVPPRSTDEDHPLSAPEAATKVSQRPVAASSSSATPVAVNAARSSSASGNVSSTVISGQGPVIGDTFRSPSSAEAAPASAHSSAMAEERHAAGEAARIAQSAAMPSLPHAVSDEQAQQIAPHVPQEALEQVRNQFEENTGSGQIDPADPDYARLWDSAERLAADQMRSLYGWAAYSEMQRQNALAAAAQRGN